MDNHIPQAGIDAPVFDAQGNRLAGSNYMAELYGGATQSSLAPALDYYMAIRNPVTFNTGANAGYFPASGGLYVRIPSVPGLGSAWLQVRAWDARLGGSYEDAVAKGVGGYGESNLFSANGGSQEFMQVPQGIVGIQSFSLLPEVPEPSTLALFGLGLAMMLSYSRLTRPRFRRRKIPLGMPYLYHSNSLSTRD